MPHLKQLCRFLCFTLLLLLLTPDTIDARAGGGGGSRRSSGGSYRSSSSRRSSGRSSSRTTFGRSSSSNSTGDSGPLGILVVPIVIIALALKYSNDKKAKTQENFVRKKQKPIVTPSFQSRKIGIKGLQKRIPDFSEELFLEKVRVAFHAIQNAWEKQDLSEVRHYISDGVWQRFHVQFLIMKKLEQVNKLSNITIEEIGIDRVEKDGQYEKIDVAIKASLDDHFICELDHSLDSGGRETFIEYWSFIKKRDSETKDLYSGQICPSCGADIAGTLGEVAQCQYCGSLVNSGEFDWILSEITQATDYHSKGVCKEAQNLKMRKKMLLEQDPDFSVQLLEDKVSNGYLQIIAAEVENSPSRVRRFVSDDFFQKISKKIEENNLIYNRLFLNDVTLLAARKQEDMNQLYVRVTSSFIRVRKEEQRLTALDLSLTTQTRIVELRRKANVQNGKGLLFMHQCSSCGAQIEDTLEVSCSYCGSLLNSGDHEWVISDILTIPYYTAMVQKNKKQFSFAANPSIIKSVMSNREYAINNIMAVLASDGKITDDELTFLQDIAHQMRFNSKECNEIVEKAHTNQLQLRMPEDLFQRKKIFDLMKKAAEADGEISPEEQALLDHIEKEYLQICPV